MSANKHFPAGTLPRFDHRVLPTTGGFRQFSSETIDQHKTCVRKHKAKGFDARHKANLNSALPRLPSDGESWHIITKGNTPLWLAIPRLIELSAEPIAELKISTLGFGQDFALYLRDASSDGRIKDFGIVCSHYFRSTSKREFDLLAKHAGKRLAVVRCHAKIIAATMRSGRAFVFEGSGNLRSCRSIEQMTVTQDIELARFHQSWITDLLNGAPTDTAV